MSNRIYVGNLPSDVRESELEDLFYKFGRIDRIDIKRMSRPPVFAFVSFRQVRDAKDACISRNGIDFDGRKLRVEHSREQPREKQRNYSREHSHDRSTESANRETYRVRVEGLSGRISWQDLKDYGRSCGGAVVRSDIIRHQEQQRNGKKLTTTVGVLEYENERDALRAVDELNNTTLKNPFEECQIFLKLDFNSSGEFGSNTNISSNNNSDSNSSSRRGRRNRYDDEDDHDVSRSRSRSRDERSRSKDHHHNNDSNNNNDYKMSTKEEIKVVTKGGGGGDDDDFTAREVYNKKLKKVVVNESNSSSGSFSNDNDINYSLLSYQELREVCKKRGLKSSGKKIDLLASLTT